MSWWSRVRQHFGFSGGQPRQRTQTTHYGDISKYKDPRYRGKIIQPKHYTYTSQRYRDPTIPKLPGREPTAPEGAPKDNLDYLSHFGVSPEAIQGYRAWLEKQPIPSPEEMAELETKKGEYAEMPWWKKLYTTPPGVVAGEPPIISPAGAFGAVSHLGKMGKATKIGKIININKIVNVAGRTGQFASGSAKAMSLTKKLLIAAGFTTFAAGFVATIVGTYPFAKFELAESCDKIGIAMFTASQKGDWENVDELSALLMEMTDEKNTSFLQNLIPFKNVWSAAQKNIDAARVSAQIFSDLAKRERERLETGQTTAQMWEDINKARADQAKADTDYWNEQKIITEETLQGMREDYNIEKEDRARDILLEEIDFWMEYKREIIEMERKAMEHRATYWLEYNKKLAKLREESYPSQLGFGLL